MNNQEDKSLARPRGFESATRLEISIGQLSPRDQRTIVVDDIQGLVVEVNELLMRRDGLSFTPKNLRKQRFEELSEEYAEKMVTLEKKYKELEQIEKDMKLIIDPL